MITTLAICLTMGSIGTLSTEEAHPAHVFIEGLYPYWSECTFVALAVPTAEAESEIRSWRGLGGGAGIDESTFQFFRVIDSLPRHETSISSIASSAVKGKIRTEFDFATGRNVRGPANLLDVSERMLIVGCDNLHDPDRVCARRHLSEPRPGEVVPFLQFRTNSTGLSRDPDLRKVMFRELAKVVANGEDYEVIGLIGQMSSWDRDKHNATERQNKVDAILRETLMPAFEARSQKPNGAFQAAAGYAAMARLGFIDCIVKSATKLQQSIANNEQVPERWRISTSGLFINATYEPIESPLNGNSIVASVLIAEPIQAGALAPFLVWAAAPSPARQRQLIEIHRRNFSFADRALSKWHSVPPMDPGGSEEELNQRIIARRQFWRDRLSD